HLQRWLSASQDESLRGLVGRMAGEASGSALSMVFGRSLADWRYRARWQREKSRLPGAARARAGQLETLIRRQRTLQRQMSSLAMARRLLAVWHAVHIPIGMALFTAAFIHIIAAFYYATLLR
ncbi:MAG: hypothetical protein L0Z70_14360, partial [Chloroflexi bacterium]|nr:hypothetical protein [Chloroflexota bacterium]